MQSNNIYSHNSINNSSNNSSNNSINLLDCQNILIIQTAFLGDTALSLYLVDVIKDIFTKHNKTCNIIFITIPAWKDLVENVSNIDEVIYIDKKKSHNSFFGLFKFAKKLNSELLNKYNSIDCVISLHKSQRTSILLSFIKSNYKVGFDNSKLSFAYDKLIKYNSNIHEVERYFSLLNAFREFHTTQFHTTQFPTTQFQAKELQTKELQTKHNLESFILPKLEDLKPINFKFDNQIEDNILRKFNLIENQSDSNKLKNYICIAPGSVWATKKWKTEYFAELINRITKNDDNEKKLENIYICILGGKNDLDTSDELQQCLKSIEDFSLYQNKILNLVGETNLLENQIILKNAKFTITNDSSPTHLSELVHTNVLTIYGPTTPKFGFAPKMKKSDFIELSGLDCKPCHIHGKNICPIKTHKCMVDLTPELVYDKFINLFNSIE